MKNILLSLLFGLVCLDLGQRVFAATELSDGELISVVNQVTTGEGASAKTSDRLTEKVPVATGNGSFAEVKFKDSSVLRVAPETKFAFASKERSINLEAGSLLMNIPSGNGGIRVEADGIQGEVTGTTLMASRDKEGNFGFVILETAGTAKVTSNTGQTANLISGQIALVRKADGSIRIFELNLDAAIQFSPLFIAFDRPMPGLEKVMAVADTQAGEVKNEIKSLLSYSEVGLAPEDCDKSPLGLLFGKSAEEMVVAKNPFLGDLATAAGKEEKSDASGQNATVLGADSGTKGGSISDARQPEGEEIASKSNPPTDTAGGLGETDTAAGAEDVAGTDTAAGGGGGADTQSPTTPSAGANPVTGGGQTGGGGTTVPPVGPGVDDTEGEATPFNSNVI